jgi:glycosyltransferase involved in cell wall biosynthesis
MSPRVTVLTAAYNQERYIGRCIESVLAQTYADWEMIIVDDGSTDNTRGVAASFCDPRIKLIA